MKKFFLTGLCVLMAFATSATAKAEEVSSDKANITKEYLDSLSPDEFDKLVEQFIEKGPKSPFQDLAIRPEADEDPDADIVSEFRRGFVGGGGRLIQIGVGIAGALTGSEALMKIDSGIATRVTSIGPVVAASDIDSADEAISYLAGLIGSLTVFCGLGLGVWGITVACRNRFNGAWSRHQPQGMKKYGIALTVASGLVGYGVVAWLWVQDKHAAKLECEAHLEETAQIALAALDVEAHVKMIAAGKIQKKEFNRIGRALVEIHKARPEIAQMYTAIGNREEIYTILDTAPAILDIPTHKWGHPGRGVERIYDPDPALIKTIQTGTENWEREKPAFKEYGADIAVYKPLIRSDGRPAGALAVTMNRQILTEKEKEATVTMLLRVGVITLLMGAILSVSFLSSARYRFKPKHMEPQGENFPILGEKVGENPSNTSLNRLLPDYTDAEANQHGEHPPQARIRNGKFSLWAKLGTGIALPFLLTNIAFFADPLVGHIVSWIAWSAIVPLWINLGKQLGERGGTIWGWRLNRGWEGAVFVAAFLILTKGFGALWLGSWTAVSIARLPSTKSNPRED